MDLHVSLSPLGPVPEMQGPACPHPNLAKGWGTSVHQQVHHTALDTKGRGKKDGLSPSPHHPSFGL